MKIIKTMLEMTNTYCNIKVDGTVLWRRYPCFCASCIDQDWENCAEKHIVGMLTTVKKV